jgi:hypothetical protein
MKFKPKRYGFWPADTTTESHLADKGKMADIPSTDRQRGTLLGLAIGDALGAAVEFEPPGSFPSPCLTSVGWGFEQSALFSGV